MSYLRITAPFSGMVTKRYADTGHDPSRHSLADTGDAGNPPLADQQAAAALPVPESVVTRVRIGGPVEVRVGALKRVFQGRISRFSGRLDTSTRTMETEVDIPNPSGAHPARECTDTRRSMWKAVPTLSRFRSRRSRVTMHSLPCYVINATSSWKSA